MLEQCPVTACSYYFLVLVVMEWGGTLGRYSTEFRKNSLNLAAVLNEMDASSDIVNRMHAAQTKTCSRVVGY